METNTEQKFEVLSGREQILRRPTMWIGAIDVTQKDMFLISDTGKIERKSVSFIPAFRKIMDEILDNSLDVLINKREAKGKINVEITEDSVCVQDNGPGIPVIKHDMKSLENSGISEAEKEEIKNTYVPFTAWTRLFSGSNFQDSEDKTTIGSHGIGSKACSVFSTKFIGETDDGKKKCVVVTENNLETKTCNVSKSSGKSGTKVQFWPDLKRFNLEKIEQVYLDLMYQRLCALSVTFPGIKFSFNGKEIKMSMSDFLHTFSDNMEQLVFTNGFIGVFPNQEDDFNFFSYVNGMYLSRGGNHIDWIMNTIVSPIRDKLCRKYKTLRPADIKNKMSAVVFLRNFPNPKFDSQTKETLTNSTSEISKFLSEIDFDTFSKKILKNDEIINPIVETFKLKEELKSRKELSHSKREKVKSDKYMASTGKKKYLLICEGLSSRGSISSALGRNGYAFYAARGVPLNAYDATIQAIVANQELKEISNILELDLFSEEKEKTIAFDKIVFANDADNDGIFIASQYIGWFTRFAPNLFKEHKIARLITPLAVIRNSRGVATKYFYSLADFKDYESKNDLSKEKIEYYKGLGSWEKESFSELFDSKGFDYFLQDLELDNEGEVYVNDWLSGKNIEKRKQYLRDFTLDIETI